METAPYYNQTTDRRPRPNWQWGQKRHKSDNEDDYISDAFSPRAATSSSSSSSASVWPPLPPRLRGASPTLPDEELTSMLQSYLDDVRYRSSHSMEGYYGYSNTHHTFLPNVSPSASSLDSGYCDPASVQSSIDHSPHPNMGCYSPWTQHHHHQHYYHSEHNSGFIANNNAPVAGDSNGFHNSATTGYVMPNNSANAVSEQEDISQIVDQVLSCIDAADQQHFDPPSSAHDEFVYRDGLETLLCHNCGALMKTKAEMCRQCGTDVTASSSAALPANDDLNASSSSFATTLGKRRKLHIGSKRGKRQKQEDDDNEADEVDRQSQYWNSSSSIPSTVVAPSIFPAKTARTRTVGIVEPRIVAALPKKQQQQPEAASKNNAFINPVAGNIGQPRRPVKTTCQDFKRHRPTSFANGAKDNKRNWYNSSSSESSSSCDSSSSSSAGEDDDEEEEEPIKVARNKKSRKSSKKNSLRRKAEALLRLATATTTASSKSDDDENKSSNPVAATSFSLKTPDDQWLYCDTRGCSFWTRKPERMDRHRQCHRPDTKYYKCPDCSLRFYSLAKMLKHDRKVHTGVKDYECRVCEAEVTDIQIHMRVHKAEKQFECPVCPMEFRHKNSLVRHLCQHTGERPYRCQSCDSAFISLHRLKEHLKKQHIAETQDFEPPKKKDTLKENKKPPSAAAAAVMQQQSLPTIVTAAPILPTMTTSFLAPQPQAILSLVQASNGQVYLLQQHQHSSSPGGNEQLFLSAPTTILADNSVLLATNKLSTAATPKVNWITQVEQQPHMASSPTLDIDLTKSAEAAAQKKDIVATALLASRVLKTQ